MTTSPPYTKNLSAFLDMVAACEGTGDAYNALFGYTPTNNRTFDNGYARHPNILTAFTQTDGTVNYSSAAGRYQFIYRTWVWIQQTLGLTDFSPASQDTGAVYLITVDGAIDDIDNGQLQAAIDACSGTWASLPASHYLQPRRTIQFAQNAYNEAGGTLA